MVSLMAMTMMTVIMTMKMLTMKLVTLKMVLVISAVQRTSFLRLRGALPRILTPVES